MMSYVYVSSAVQLFSDTGLIELLTKCQLKNAQLNISGMLLYHDGNFLQVLEGPDGPVDCLVDKISADSRHRNLMCLEKKPVASRNFAGWAMAFQNLKDPSLRNLEGYSEFMNEKLDPAAFRADSTRVHRLMSVFHRSMKR